jgi:hypothetical protein
MSWLDMTTSAMVLSSKSREDVMASCLAILVLWGVGHEHPMIRRKYIGEEVLGGVYVNGIECVRGRERLITV